jgi:tetratricopeptide (TPR) repeat protein
MYLDWGLRLHLVRGDLDGARQWLDRLEEAAPTEGLSPFEQRVRRLFRSWSENLRDRPDDVVAEALDVVGDPTCMDCLGGFLPPLLEQAGRSREARDAWKDLVGRRLPNEGFSIIQIPLALRESGRLSEELGDTDEALAAYRQLLDLWVDPGPEMQPFVDRLRSRVEELERASSGS